MGFPTPFAKHEAVVLPEWIDRNGHMNLAYYVVIFDHATDALFDALGIGEAYSEATKASLFAVEMHTVYLQELREGERVRLRTLVLGADEKRLHFLHEMIRFSDNALAATQELLALHVDLRTRRARAFPPSAKHAIAAAVAAHQGQARAGSFGRAIALPSKQPVLSDRLPTD